MTESKAYRQRLTIAPVTQERIAHICKQIGLKDPIAIRALEVCLIRVNMVILSA
jgi:hypothetical protein